MQILIDGVAVPWSEYHRLVIRFVPGIDAPVPILYRDGKRVTGAVVLSLASAVPPDQCGGNANTA